MRSKSQFEPSIWQNQQVNNNGLQNFLYVTSRKQHAARFFSFIEFLTSEKSQLYTVCNYFCHVID